MNMQHMNMSTMSPDDTDMQAAMAHMMKDMHMTKLSGVQDEDFMLMMIPHHRSAVEMAQMVGLRIWIAGSMMDGCDGDIISCERTQHGFACICRERQ
jgi:hypothetical protein